MGWFDHQHYWTVRDVHEIKWSDRDTASGVIRIEECSCGAIRTIEYKPGSAPIVRMAVTEEKRI